MEACINSILIQSHEGFELILVNDGSTDFSGEICDVFSDTDKRIWVVHKENKDFNNARITGIEAAKNDLLYPLLMRMNGLIKCF